MIFEKLLRGLHKDHLRPYRWFLVFAISLLIGGCSNRTTLHKYEFQDGEYFFRHENGRSFEKVYVVIQDDTVHIIPKTNVADWRPEKGKDQVFLKRSFDFDILTVPFKYRPISLGFPRQLNANVNGNAFLGLRFDRFKVQFKQTPVGMKKFQTHRGFSIGGFAGLGSAAITPWTTNNQTADEYEGLVLTRGLAAMIGVNNVTFGLGIGWDYLTDRDKGIWIYQNKPWYGVTVGLNLN